MAHRTHPHIAALTLDVQSGAEIQLLPAGSFRARDGRPHGIAAWRLDAELAAGLMRAATMRQTPFVIDYEHQTLLAESNGQPAPAAGWFKTIEWREGQGLFATDVQWTERARAMIDAGEYRFLSPVFSFAPHTGAVLQILHCALTNVPALDGMSEVAAAAARFFNPDHPTEEIHVNELLKKLLAKLGLQDTTSEDDALAAVSALKAKSDQVAGLETQVAALKAAAPDPSKYAPVETMQALQQQVAALTTKLNGQELDAVVDDALKAGKLLPAQEAWARDLGAKDVASLKSYLANAPVIVPQGTQTQERQQESGGQLSAEEQAVCKQLGLTPEAYLKTKAAA